MTAEFFRAFQHEHNLLQVAEQEYELANQEYETASSVFDSQDPRKVDAFHNARERRNLAWDAWWVLKRGY